MRIVMIISGIATLLILLPLWLVLPPLKSAKPVERTVSYAALNALSEPAQAGRAAFGARCAECHGIAAQGSAAAPGLLEREYAADFRDSDEFHGAVGRKVPAHQGVIREVQANSRRAFNQLELMAKFLRELNRNAANKR